jgi:hypothetical protein
VTGRLLNAIIRDEDFEREGITRRGVTMSRDGAGYQPVAWWFTKRRLGRELRDLYQAAEELPPRLLALIGRLGVKPDSSREVKSDGASPHQ